MSGRVEGSPVRDLPEALCCVLEQDNLFSSLLSTGSIQEDRKNISIGKFPDNIEKLMTWAKSVRTNKLTD